MSDEIIAYSLSHHPAPHRARISIWAILYGLFAASIFWAGHLMLNYAIATHACYPGDAPLARPDSGAGWAWPLILGLDLLTLCLIVSSFFVAWRSWRLSGEEREGGHPHLVELGEGRTRFLGVVGMSFAVLFFFITMTDTISLAMVPLCAR